MTLITYDRVLDEADRLTQKVRRRAAGGDLQPKPIKESIGEEAEKRFDNIVGRFDTLTRVPCRELLPPVDDREEEVLKKLGAKKREDGQWIVPEDVELDARFHDFYPEAPADLRDRTPRLLLTRRGRMVEGYVLPEDRGKGSDSTATALMYAGIVAVAGLCYLAMAIWPPLVLLTLLLFIPFTVALAQGEGPMEAAKSVVLLGLLPFMVASGSATVPSGAGSMMSNPLMMGGSIVAMFGIGMVAAFLFTLFDKNANVSVVGSAFQKFKAMVEWGAVIGGSYALISLLPAAMQPFFFLAMPAFYPMVYTNANFVRRSKILKENGERANVGRMGRLTDAHVEPKRQQVINAFNDKTPLITLGTSTGYLTKKNFAYAPDEKVAMVLSAHDFSKHLLVFGETGIGKTTNIARGTAKQWMASEFGGALFLDGKGALPGELSAIIHVLIRRGVDFAPFQGMDGIGIATALNSTAKSGGGGNPSHMVWEQGADDYVVRCCVLFDALHNHEKNYKRYAGDMARLKELDIDASLVEIAQLEKRSEDVSEAQAKLERNRLEHDSWAVIRDTDRKWLWNVDTLVKVFNMVNAPVKGPNGWEAGTLLAEAVKFLGLESEPVRQARRKALQPATVHPEIGGQTLLDDALDFVLNTWTSYEPQQRSSFFLNVNQRVLPLTTDPYLVGENGRHWKTLETGVDAGVCLFGGSVGVELPEERHQRAGVLISALVKQRVYNAVALRGGNPNWRDEGQKPLMVMIDEAQDLVSDAERQLLPKARSLGMCAVMLTQNWEGLENKLGNEMKALQFCNTFQNYVLMRSSAKTYQFFLEKLGTAQMLTYEQPVMGLDMHGGVLALQASPINDPDHPNRSAMRQMERQGAGQLVVRVPRPDGTNGWNGHAMVNIEDHMLTKHIAVPQTGQLKIQQVFLPEEYSALLTFGKAILVLNRAGERRIDLATMHPVYEHELRKAS